MIGRPKKAFCNNIFDGVDFKLKDFANAKKVSRGGQSRQSTDLFLIDGEVSDTKKKRVKKSNFDKKKENIEKQQHFHQQDKIRNNIEIKGIPERKNQDVYLILESLAKIINVEFKPEDVSKVCRNGNNKSVNVTFREQSKKCEWSAAAKKKGRLNANEFDEKFPATAVYINEQLTPYYKRIFSIAKEMTRNKKLFSVWVENSNILIKKSRHSKVIRIKVIDDLNDLDDLSA